MSRQPLNPVAPGIMSLLRIVLVALSIASLSGCSDSGVKRPELAAERFMGLSESALMEKLRRLDLPWAEEERDERSLEDTRGFILKDTGLDVFCMAGHVIEVNLYGPDNRPFAIYDGVMPRALRWGTTLEATIEKCGVPQRKKDVVDQDVYCIGYESGRRRLILAFTRTDPRRLKGIRVQAIVPETK